MTTLYSMSSKERLLAAIDRQSVDHIPLLLRFWSMGGTENNIPFAWEDQVATQNTANVDWMIPCCSGPWVM
jgi:hypothetical protein